MYILDDEAILWKSSFVLSRYDQMLSAYDMIRIHGVKKALTHISVKLRERMQYLNGGVYLIHVWKNFKASYKDFRCRVIFYQNNNRNRIILYKGAWTGISRITNGFDSDSTRKLIPFLRNMQCSYYNIIWFLQT